MLKTSSRILKSNNRVLAAYSASTLAFINALEGDGNKLTDIQKYAAHYINSGIDVIGRSKFKAVYPYLGGSAYKHKFNMMNPVDSDAAFRLSFNGGWTHNSTGIVPNGTNTYADTHLVPSVHLNQNSLTIANYSPTLSTGGVSRADMGAYSGAASPNNNTRVEIYNNNDTNMFFPLVNVSDSNVSGVSNTDTRGLFIASRTSSTLLTGFRNDSKVLTNTSTSKTLITIPIYIGASNYTAAPGFTPGANFFTTRTQSFNLIALGLTDIECGFLNAVIQGYQSILSRNPFRT